MWDPGGVCWQIRHSQNGGASTRTDAGSLIAEEQLGRSGARLEQDGHEVPVSYLEETENNSCLEIAI